MCRLARRLCGCGHYKNFLEPCGAGNHSVPPVTAGDPAPPLPVENGSPAPEELCLGCQQKANNKEFYRKRGEEQARDMQAQSQAYNERLAEFDRARDALREDTTRKNRETAQEATRQQQGATRQLQGASQQQQGASQQQQGATRQQQGATRQLQGASQQQQGATRQQQGASQQQQGATRQQQGATRQLQGASRQQQGATQQQQGAARQQQGASQQQQEATRQRQEAEPQNDKNPWAAYDQKHPYQPPGRKR